MCGYWQFKITHYFHVHGSFLFVLEEVLAVISFLSQAAFCVSNSFYNKENRKLWQQLYEMERNIITSNIALNHKFLQRVALGCVIFMVINTFLLFATSQFLYSNIGEVIDDRALILGTALFYSYRCGTLSFVISQYVSSFSILREIFLKLGEAAKRSFLFSDRRSSKDLLQIARYHQQCCALARNANSVISVQLLVELMEVVGLLVIASFIYAASIAMYDTYQNSVVYAGWVVFGIFRALLLIVISHRCMASVSFICWKLCCNVIVSAETESCSKSRISLLCSKFIQI